MNGVKRPETAFLASESPLSVHTLETTCAEPSQPSERSSRAISQLQRQASALELYSHLDYSPENSKARRLQLCRKTGYFVRHKETGQVRLALESCKLRWCALCGSAKVSWITHSVSEWLANRSRPKFATFTLKHRDIDLEQLLDDLYRFFFALRRSKDFCSHVRGGIWFFHIKLSSADGLWHIHLHCVLDSDYFPQAELSDLWLKITGNSRIVDIRKIDNPGKAANEVARYAACPCDLSKNTLDNNVNVLRALHGKRICGAWGTAKGVRLKPPRDEHPELWINVGSRTVILELCKTDPAAAAIYQAWRNQTYLESDINCRALDDWLDGDFKKYIARKDADYGSLLPTKS